MLNLKKVIASICVIAMMLSTVAFAATYTDVAEDSAYYEAVETLNKLEIVTGYEDGTFKPEDGVTRAEMAALIARIQGYGETAKGSANTGFTDVPASHWASGYVANAAGMGIINGYGDGTFGPEDPVLYEQAVKMIMATLGYTPFAEKNGGYPTGYLAAAQRYDVSLAVANAAIGQPANRGTVAQLLENALDTPLMVQSSWNTNGEVVYVIADGKVSGGIRADYKTLMSENLGYVKVRGILVDAGLITIAKPGSKTFDVTEDPAVGIKVIDDYNTDNPDFDGVDPSKKATKNFQFLTGTTDAADYLGQSVIGYVKKLPTDEYELVSIAVDTNRNDVLVIDLDQYSGINASDNVEYYKDGDDDTTEIDIEASMAVVYNNECMKTGTTDDEGTAYIKTLISSTPFKFGGTITFIDNDDTPGYNVAIIEAAATAVVKKVTEDGVSFKKTINLPDGAETMSALEIDADDETKVVVIYKDGEIVDAASLNEWDVLSVIAAKENANVIVAEVVSNQVVGTIASRKASKTSDTGFAYSIGGAWYDVAKSAYKASAADLEVGVGGTFSIDKYGKIAAFDEDTALAGGAVANYGYITAVEEKAADFSADGFAVNVQIVTADGVEVLKLKKNAKIKLSAVSTLTVDTATWTDGNDNGKVESGDTGYADLTAIKGLKNTVVKYAKNAAGAISEITTAFDAEKFYNIPVTAQDYEYDADNSRFLGAGYVDEDAIVFFIDGTDATESKVGTLADLDHENMYTVNAKYADNKATDCNIVVIDAASLKTSTTSNVAVITEVGEGTNDDGEAILYLSFYLDGALNENVASIAKSELTDSTFTQGDVAKIKVGSDGLITDAKLIFNFADGVRTNHDNTTLPAYANVKTAKEIFAGGVVTAYKDSSALATIATKYTTVCIDTDDDSVADSDTDATTQYKLSQAENVYVIDATGLNINIKLGSEGNFKVFDALYDDTAANVTVSNDAGPIAGATNIAEAAAAAYGDHVYVRSYEGKVKDVIIVKAAKDIKIK